MKIGFITSENKKEISLLEARGVDEILIAEASKGILPSFHEFLLTHQQDDLYIVDLLTYLPVPLLDLREDLAMIVDQQMSFTILNKGEWSTLSDSQYVLGLLQIVNREVLIRKYRSSTQLKVILEVGVSRGRPTIDQETIAEIIVLKRDKQLTYRKIAELCHVSLGTVAKYIRRSAEFSDEV